MEVKTTAAITIINKVLTNASNKKSRCSVFGSYDPLYLNWAH
jgi:hypothetical protein